MGVDLDIYPVVKTGQHYYCISVLRVERQRELWNLILAQNPIHDPNMEVWLPDRSKKLPDLTDAYDNKIHYLENKKLIEAFESASHLTIFWNEAILAFLKKLPPDLRILLFWH